MSERFELPPDIKHLRADSYRDGPKLNGYGKNYSKTQFENIVNEFQRKFKSDPLIMNSPQIYEPLLYLISKYVTSQSISSIARKSVNSILEYFTVVLIDVEFDESQRSIEIFLRTSSLLFTFIDLSISTSKTKGIMDIEVGNKRGKNKNEDLEIIYKLQIDIVKTFDNCLSKSAFINLVKTEKHLSKIVRKMIKVLLLSPVGVPKRGEEAHEVFYSLMKKCLFEKIIIPTDLNHDLTSLICDYEQSVKPIANFLCSCVSDESPYLYSFLVDLLKSICMNECMSKGKSKSDNKAVRHLKMFFDFLQQELFEVFYSNLDTFQYLLDSPCYSMRLIYCEMLTNIVEKKFSGLSRDDPIYETKCQKRDEFLTILIRRTLDEAANGRTSVLGNLYDLVIQNMVPEDILQQIFFEACARIKDVSGNVRKKAICLVSEILTIFQEKMKFGDSEKIQSEIEHVDAEVEQTIKDEGEESEKLPKLRHYKEYLLQCTKCYQTMNDILPFVAKVMGIGASGDSQEAIRLVVSMIKLGLASAREHLGTIYTLIYSKEDKICGEVLSSFIRLFAENRREYEACDIIAEEYMKASFASQKCLLEIIFKLFKQGKTLHDDPQSGKKDILPHFPKQYLDYLFAHFRKRLSSIDPTENKKSIVMLKYIRQGLRVWVTWMDERTIKDFNRMIRDSISDPSSNWELLIEFAGLTEDMRNEVALKSFNTTILKGIGKILVNTQGTSDNNWFVLCRHALKSYFANFDKPHEFAEFFIKKLTEFMTGVRTGSDGLYGDADELAIKIESQRADINMGIGEDAEIKVAQLIYASGEIAIHMMIYLEQIKEECKRRLADKADLPGDLDRAALEQELEISTSQLLADSHWMDKDGLIAGFNPVILGYFQEICKKCKTSRDVGYGSVLYNVIIQTMCKFMLVSKSICQLYAGDLIELVGSSLDPAIQINVSQSC